MRSYTPLRYPGGKAKLYDTTTQLLKKNKLDNITYIEPFAGGCGLALKLLLTNVVDNLILNDIDYNLYCFWQSVLYDSNILIEKIKDTPITIDEWYTQKDVYNNPQNFSPLEIGFSTFFLNRTNFSGILSAGPLGGYHQSGKYKIDCRFNKKKLIQIIDLIHSFRNKISFYNLDAIKFINSNRKLLEDDMSFTFIDPPYFEKGKQLYINFYNKDDHKNLSKTIKTINGNWIITYDNVLDIKEFYHNDFYTDEYEINYSVMDKTKGTELIIYSNTLKSI